MDRFAATVAKGAARDLPPVGPVDIPLQILRQARVFGLDGSRLGEIIGRPVLPRCAMDAHAA